MPVKFKVKPHMMAGPKSTLDEPEPLPENPDAPDHEPIFKIKDFPQNYITYHVHKATAGKRKARHHNVVHISDLDPARNWCPREPAVLTILNRKRPDTFLTPAMKMTFGMGNKGADLLMELMPPEKVWGHWKCKACAHEMKFTYTPTKCEACGGDRKAIRYKEVLVRDPKTGIVGSVDCFVDILGNGLRTGVEIKTEGHDTFKKRSKPTFDHEWRSRGYLWLMNQDALVRTKGVNLHEMRIIYFTKEGWIDDPRLKEWGSMGGTKTALKEYWCTRDDSVIENQINRARAYRKFRDLWDAKHTDMAMGAVPGRHAKCMSAACAMAKACPVRKECWSGDLYSGN